MACAWFPQHTSKQLLYRRGRVQRGHADQDLGEGAVPTLGQRALSDDELDWAGTDLANRLLRLTGRFLSGPGLLLRRF
jgi:hypothetical protein